jgi:adenine-specific DNA methylase
MNSSAFIEQQFPVSKVSKESYKERKAVAGQTLTGLGKWWGRKPLVLVRATIIGLLLPATQDPEKDQEVFLRLMTMDENGLLRRRDKNLRISDVAELLNEEERAPYLRINNSGNWAWKKKLDPELKKEAQDMAFLKLSYDEQLKYAARPEQIDGPSPESWKIINAHCGTTSSNLQEWVEQMGEKQFGHTAKVGDAFCGGGSIPFEAARLGCEAYGSDLNPVAALLTWASINIIGGGPEVKAEIEKAQQEVFEAVDQQIIDWGIEHDEDGCRADAYLYCVEAKSPATGYWVPLAPSWVISEKYKVCAVLHPDLDRKRYDIEIITDADNDTFEKAKKGTVQDGRMICPETGKDYNISTLRGDRRVDGETQYGLRMWENEDIVPRPDDVFQERLYCIRYVKTFYYDKKTKRLYTTAQAEKLPEFEVWLESGRLREEIERHYVAPTASDLGREEKVLQLVKERFSEWQEKGYIPSAKIPKGYNTEQPIRERGWTHWHHLFTPRQLLVHGMIGRTISGFKKEVFQILGFIIQGRFADWNSRLSVWLPSQSGGNGGGKNTFLNQALNTIFNFSNRGFLGLSSLAISLKSSPVTLTNERCIVRTCDSREIEKTVNFWITDPPYADAINYHELGDFFLAWYQKRLTRLSLNWHTNSKAALAVKGKGQSFNRSMVEVYRNLTEHMPDNGAQVVMFTHQDAAVWADLALILWASGLRVTAAWTIQTETDAGGIKKGNYVQGTVIMVLRKQTSDEMGFLSDIQMDVEQGVKEQITFMQQLDDKDDPNFGDADYQLAAYAAALRELTRYSKLDVVDVDYELNKERQSGEDNEIVKIIESAVRVAMDVLVPNGFSEANWRKLSPIERFYLKGLEVEQGGEYRSGVYTEMARGYGLREYRHLLKVKANETRLITPLEYKIKDLGGEDFGGSLTRQILFAIHETHKAESPVEGRNWLYHEWPDYWSSRSLMLTILKYLILKTKDIKHWAKDVEAAELLKGYLENDTMG